VCVFVYSYPSTWCAVQAAALQGARHTKVADACSPWLQYWSPAAQHCSFLHGCSELLAAGLRVRAGARDVEAAQADTETAIRLGLLTQDQASRVEWVTFDLADPESIPAALGNATKV